MQLSKFTSLLIAMFVATVMFGPSAHAEANQETSGHGLGLKPNTPEEDKEFRKRTIKKVRPNALGLDRINRERRAHGKDPIPEISGDEFEVINGSEMSDVTVETFGTASAQVDNSLLPAFPSVLSQGSLPSCVAWATTYYQMSHEVCLMLGCDNKSLKSKVFAPSWTYNFINGGVSQGTSFGSAYSVIERHGAALNSEFPYTSNYKLWDMNAEHWKNAISHRMKVVQTAAANTDAGMANVKQILANGHVVVFGTYINSWVYGKVQARPGTTAAPFLGQNIVRYQNGTAGAHAMTIVGYDDSIWTDMNANGAVEASELGAFKIANSWGATWNGSGYVWASYDSLRSATAVAGFAPAGRNQLLQSGLVYLTTYVPYQPKLLGKVTMSHLMRNQMSLSVGSSSTSTQTPQMTLTLPGVSRAGGAYAFNGSTIEVEGTFYFDLTSLYNGFDVNQQLFYFMFTDSTSGTPLAVKSFEIVDPAVGNFLAGATNVPAYADGSTSRLIAGNVSIDATAPSAPLNLTASKVSVKKGKRVTTSIALKWSAATDNVGVAKYAVYRNGVKIAESASVGYSDGTGTMGTTYTYQVTAIDAQGNQSSKSNSVSITR